MPPATNDNNESPGRFNLARPAKRRFALGAINLALTAVIVYFVGREIYKRFADIRWATVSIDYIYLAAAAAGVLANRLFTVQANRAMITAFDQRLTLRQVAGITWTASLARYLPVKFSASVGMTVLLVRHGVRLAVAMVLSVLTTAISVALGVILALPLLVLHEVMEFSTLRWLLSAAVIVAGVAFLHPAVFIRVLDWILLRLRRRPLAIRPDPRWYLAGAGYVALRYAAACFTTWMVACALTDVPAGDVLPVAGATVLAAVAGVAAFFAPAGIGVQESIYIILLTDVIGAANSAMLVIMLRLMLITTDAAAGLLGWGVLLRPARRKNHAARPGAKIPQ